MTQLEQQMQTRRVRPTDLAREAEVSYRYLSLVRSGQCEPSVTRAIRIASAMTRLTRKRLTVEDLWAA